MKKRKQHYVWRYYLRGWSKDDKIFCLRNGKIFSADLMGVANERDFYKIKELSQEEVKMIETLAIKDSPESLKAIHRRYLHYYILPYRLKASLIDNGTWTGEVAKKGEELINNLEEDFHSSVEGNATKYLDRLLKKDIDFYKTEDDKMEFLLYLCTQYMRTKSTKQNVIKATGYQGAINTENMWNALSNIYATNVAYNLSARPEFHLVVLVNCTDKPFITGDQPVINTFAVGKKEGETVKELELYYPLSPTLALLLTSNKDYIAKALVEISEQDRIDLYNSYIYKESYEQIYATSEDALKKYL